MPLAKVKGEHFEAALLTRPNLQCDQEEPCSTCRKVRVGVICSYTKDVDPRYAGFGIYECSSKQRQKQSKSYPYDVDRHLSDSGADENVEAESDDEDNHSQNEPGNESVDSLEPPRHGTIECARFSCS